MHEITLKLKVARVDGPAVEEEQIVEALEEAVQQLDFEAGDEPSVFTVDDTELA